MNYAHDPDVASMLMPTRKIMHSGDDIGQIPGVRNSSLGSSHSGMTGCEQRSLPVERALPELRPKGPFCKSKVGQEEATLIVKMDQTGRDRKSSTSSMCLCQPNPKVPRPRNAFILYRQHHQSRIVAAHPELTNPEVSKIIGDEWNNLRDEAKNEWRSLAEQEKTRHSQQFPDYRYQPRRSLQRNSLPRSRSDIHIDDHCTNCGGLSIMTPANNGSNKPLRPVLPHPTAMPNGDRQMPSVSELNLNPSNHVRRISSSSNNGYPVAGNGMVFSPITPRYPIDRQVSGPDLKRRRITNGDPYGSISVQPMPSPQYQYPTRSPYHDTFGRPMETLRYGNPLSAPLAYPHRASITAPPPPPPQQRDPNLTLPPMLSTDDQSRSVEAMIMSMHFLGKIRVLGKVSPPLKTPARGSPVFITAGKKGDRGPVIAVEGDNPKAVAKVLNYLHRHLAEEIRYHVRVAHGPALAPAQAVGITDYHDMIRTWRQRCQEIVDFVTSLPKTGNEADTTPTPTPPPTTTTTTTTMTVRNEAETPPSPKDTSKPNTSLEMVVATDENKSNTNVSHSPTIDAAAAKEIKAMVAPEIAAARDADLAAATGAPVDTPDVVMLDEKWQRRQRQPPPQHPAGPNPITPVLLMHHYQLHATNAYAARVPITDNYSPVEHWQWMASLWRGTVGPDLTVFVKDCGAEEMERASLVEVRRDPRCVIVRRAREHDNEARGGAGGGATGGGGNVEDGTLRRVGFEVSELVRAGGFGVRGGVALALGSGGGGGGGGGHGKGRDGGLWNAVE